MPTSSQLPQVSVIVPVYNDHGEMAECLKCLLRQTYPEEKYEVIIVDNGSSPPLADALDAPERVQLCYESRPGSYAARNKGIEVSQGDILAFTDADCRPAQAWIEPGVARLQETGSDIAGGRIDFTFEGERPNPWEYYDAVTFLDQEKYVRNYDFGATANLFVRRNIFSRFGRFLDDLPSSGDAEFCQRAVEKGAEITYADAACVKHKARTTLRQVLSKHERIRRGKKTLADKGLADWNPPSFQWKMLLPPWSLPLLDGVRLDGLYRWKVRIAYTLVRWGLSAKLLTQSHHESAN